MKAYGRFGGIDPPILKLCNSGKHFTPGERVLGISRIGSWVETRTSLEALDKREISYPYQESNHDSSVLQPIV